jgi:hypothetical protein
VDEEEEQNNFSLQQITNALSAVSVGNRLIQSIVVVLYNAAEVATGLHGVFIVKRGCRGLAWPICSHC